MRNKPFKEVQRQHQEYLIKNTDLFDYDQGEGIAITKDGKKKYPHILSDASKNLYIKIRQGVDKYFENNSIYFWGGKLSANTLSSQVSCLNHLFLIREDKEASKAVLQTLVGDKFKIDKLVEIKTDKEKNNTGFIAFEMISDEKSNGLNEKNPKRGFGCTSIDAFAIAEKSDGTKVKLVIEWKYVEDDSGNEAPTKESSTNTKEIKRGQIRVEEMYGKLINESNYLNMSTGGKLDCYYNSDYFRLPYYELMRQTLWGERNKIMDVEDYIHIYVLPPGNPMRKKEDTWRKLLSEEGNKRFIVADPKSVVDILYKAKDYATLVEYLNKRYYSSES